MVCLGLSLKKPRARSESDLKVDSFSGSTNFKAVFLLDMLKSPELSGLACKGTISMNCFWRYQKFSVRQRSALTCTLKAGIICGD